jgi:hypothetical protein
MFSRRRVIFEYHSVRWECNQCAWYEDIYVGRGLDQRTGKYPQDLFSLSYSDMLGYRKMAESYQKSKLTFLEDSLVALAGITEALSQSSEGSFLCGLSELFLDSAIMWPWIGSPNKKILPSTCLEYLHSHGQVGSAHLVWIIGEQTSTRLLAWSWIPTASKIETV